MASLITIVYPDTRDLVFDLDYYTSSHIPLCERILRPYGLVHTYVVDLRATPGPYAVQCTMVFETGAASFRKAMMDRKELTDDLKNYSNVAPVLLAGALVVDQ